MSQERNRITPGVGAALAAFFFFLGVVAASQVYLGGAAPLIRGVAPRVQAGDSVDTTVVFGQRRAISRSEAFRQGDVAVLFGDSELDLRDARLAPGGAKVDVLAAFGRVHMTVPEDWSVERGDVMILGAYVNHGDGATPDPAKVLRLDGLVFGGAVEVTH